MRLTRLAAVPVLLWLAAVPAARGGEPSETLPRISALPDALAVVRSQNVASAINHAADLADLVLPGMGMQMKMGLLQSIFQDPTGRILDPSAPSAFILGDPKNYETNNAPPLCFVVASTDGAAMFNALAVMAKKDPAAAADGVLADPEDDFYLEAVGTNVLLASSRALLDDVASALENDPALLGSAPMKGDLDAVVDVKRILRSYGESLNDWAVMLAQMAKIAAAQQQNAGPQPAVAEMFRGFLPLAAPLLKMLPRLLEQIDGFRIVLGIDPDHDSGGISLACRVYPVKGSRLEKLLAGFLQPLDLEKAKEAAARLPQGIGFLAATADGTELAAVLKDAADKIAKVVEEEGVPEDALLKYLLSEVPALVPPKTYTTVFSVKADDSGFDMVGITVPPVLEKEPLADAYRSLSEALAASQVYQALLMAAGQGNALMVKGFNVEDLPEAGGLRIVSEYGDLNPGMLEVMKTFSGDPPAFYVMYLPEGDSMLWYQGGRGLEGAKDYAGGAPDAPLSNGDAFNRLLSRMPEGTSWVGGVRLVSALRMQLQALSANPMLGPQMAMFVPMLKNFEAGDQEIECYLYSRGGTAGCKLFIPAKTITNVSSAFQAAMMMGAMGGGGNRPGGRRRDEQEEDLPF